jgi:hypothetical protein
LILLKAPLFYLVCLLFIDFIRLFVLILIDKPKEKSEIKLRAPTSTTLVPPSMNNNSLPPAPSEPNPFDLPPPPSGLIHDSLCIVIIVCLFQVLFVSLSQSLEPLPDEEEAPPLPTDDLPPLPDGPPPLATSMSFLLSLFFLSFLLLYLFIYFWKSFSSFVMLFPLLLGLLTCRLSIPSYATDDGQSVGDSWWSAWCLHDATASTSLACYAGCTVSLSAKSSNGNAATANAVYASSATATTVHDATTTITSSITTNSTTIIPSAETTD